MTGTGYTFCLFSFSLGEICGEGKGLEFKLPAFLFSRGEMLSRGEELKLLVSRFSRGDILSRGELYGDVEWLVLKLLVFLSRGDILSRGDAFCELEGVEFQLRVSPYSLRGETLSLGESDNFRLCVNNAVCSTGLEFDLLGDLSRSRRL